MDGRSRTGCGKDQVDCEKCSRMKIWNGDPLCSDCRLKELLEKRKWHEEVIAYLDEEIEKLLDRPPAEVIPIGGAYDR